MDVDSLKLKARNSLVSLAYFYQFTVRVLKSFSQVFLEWREILHQCYRVGNKSLLLICFTAFIAGIVFTKQSRPSLESFGAESWLPSLVSIAIVRSLGPLITALICAGKLGSNIGAELGSMRVTEQIDAMEVSGTRPFSYLITSRVVATTLMLPVLVVFADVVGLLGSFLLINILNNTSFTQFVNEVTVSITFLDIFSSLIKSAFFGLAIGLMACYHGYNASKGTIGVGIAANSAVVSGLVSVFILDLIGLQFLNLFR